MSNRYHFSTQMQQLQVDSLNTVSSNVIQDHLNKSIEKSETVEECVEKLKQTINELDLDLMTIREVLGNKGCIIQGTTHKEKLSENRIN